MRTPAAGAQATPAPAPKPLLSEGGITVRGPAAPPARGMIPLHSIRHSPRATKQVAPRSHSRMRQTEESQFLVMLVVRTALPSPAPKRGTARNRRSATSSPPVPPSTGQKIPGIATAGSSECVLPSASAAGACKTQGKQRAAGTQEQRRRCVAARRRQHCPPTSRVEAATSACRSEDDLPLSRELNVPRRTHTALLAGEDVGYEWNA